MAGKLLARGPAFWGTLLALSVSAVAALRISGAVEPPAGYLLMMAAMALLVPFARSCMARQRQAGCVSAAIQSYTRRMLLASFAYMLGLGIAVSLHQRLELAGAAAFLVALLPVLPTFWMIWAMGRYLVEEQDEYLRHRAILASLIGLGAVLSIGSFWGFLETFGLVPHVPGWWAVPIWAIGMGAGQGWLALRDRRGTGA
jgi:hypothetical protein